MMLSTTMTFLTVTYVFKCILGPLYLRIHIFFIHKCIILVSWVLEAWKMCLDYSPRSLYPHIHTNTKPDPRVSQVFSTLFLSLFVKKRERQTNAVAFNCHGEEYNIAGLKYSAHFVSKHNSLNIIVDYNSQTEFFLFVWCFLKHTVPKQLYRKYKHKEGKRTRS